MTRDDIIRLRKECDQWAEDHLQCKGEYHPDFHTVSDERFAALVAAAEREALMALLEGIDKTELESPDGWWETSIGAEFGAGIFAAIRARGQA